MNTEVRFDLLVVTTSFIARASFKSSKWKRVECIYMQHIYIIIKNDKKTRCFSVCFRLNIGKNDLVTFYDGDDLTAKVLGQYGGSKSRFKLYTSTADVTIQFQSDPATNIYGYGNGFVVHFFGKSWNCLQVRHNRLKGKVQSTNN